MLKLLRKYKAIILVIGGSLLMVVFLLPQAAQQFGSFDPMAQTYARMDGKKVTGSMLSASNSQRRIAQQIAPALFSANGVGLPDDQHHWFMLVKLAKEAGLIGGPSDAGWIEEWVIELESAEIVRTQYSSFLNDPATVQLLLDRERTNARLRIDARRQSLLQAGQTEETIGNALANVAGIRRLFNQYESSGTISKPEAMDLANRVNDVLIVQAGILGVEAVEEFITLPNEEEMVEHFEAYKDARAVEDELGIGYLRPPAMRVEWLTVSRSAVESGLSLDPIEVNKFWRQARAENPDLYPADFAEAREQVEQALRRRKAAEAMDAVDQVIRREVQDARRGLASEGVFKVLPDDWAVKRADLYDIATVVDGELESRFGVQGGMPSVNESDGVFRSGQELSELAGVGRAEYQLGGNRPFSMIGYLFQAKELDGDLRLGVQEGLLYGPGKLGGLNGDRVYVRVLETRDESPPGSMEEVREQVLEDMQLARAMAYFDEHQSEIVEELGLEHDEQLALPITKGAEWIGVEVTRDEVVRSLSGSRFLEPRLNTEDFRFALHNMVARWDTKSRPNIMYHAAERTMGLLMPSAKGLVVAQVRTRRPMTLEQFRQSGPVVQRVAQTRFAQSREDQPFSLDRLKERLDYVVLDEEDETGSEEEPVSEDEVASGAVDSEG